MTVKLIGSSSGSVSLQAPASTSGGANRVLTLPDADATLLSSASSVGKILQVVTVLKTDSFSTTSTSSVDITGFTLSITPTRADSKILVLASGYISSQGADHGVHLYFYRTVSGQSDVEVGKSYNQTNPVQSQTGGTFVIQNLDSPATTASVTYMGRLRTDSGSYNARIGAGGNGGTANIPESVITLMEVAA